MPRRSLERLEHIRRACDEQARDDATILGSDVSVLNVVNVCRRQVGCKFLADVTLNAIAFEEYVAVVRVLHNVDFGVIVK